VFGDQRHMIVTWRNNPLDLTINCDTGREEP
jgi:hypothetical protein